MIDFHSHILPTMDDGSRSVEESLAMLQRLSEQGVDTVVATPHFYADEDSLERFLSRRERKWALLREAIVNENGIPRILCGAEIRYYSGISRLPELRSLCIEGTKLLLLEMHEVKWTEYTVREVLELANRGNLKLVLAHVERCLGYQSKATVQRLRESGVLMQCNASFFAERSTRRRALAMMKKNEMHLLGSDCHNITSRPPRMGEALDVISHKLGKGFLEGFCEREYALLERYQVK